MTEPGQIAKWFNRWCNDAICDEFGAGDCTCAGFLIQARAEGMREAARIAENHNEDNPYPTRQGAIARAILSAIGDSQ